MEPTDPLPDLDISIGDETNPADEPPEDPVEEPATEETFKVATDAQGRDGQLERPSGGQYWDNCIQRSQGTRSRTKSRSENEWGSCSGGYSETCELGTVVDYCLPDCISEGKCNGASDKCGGRCDAACPGICKRKGKRVDRAGGQETDSEEINWAVIRTSGNCLEAGGEWVPGGASASAGRLEAADKAITSIMSPANYYGGVAISLLLLGATLYL